MNIMNRSIKHKIVIAFTVVILFSVAVISVTFYIINNNSFNKRAQDEMNIISDLVSIGINSALMFDDKTEVYDILSRMIENSEIIEAHIIINDTLYVSTSASLHSYDNFISKNVSFYTDDSGIWILRDLKDDYNNTLAKIAIKSSLNALNKDQIQLRNIMFFIFFVLLIVSFFLSRFLIINLIRPLLAVEAGIREITEKGDNSLRISIENNDEIGRLADYINKMLSSLEEQSKTIRDSEMKYKLIAENTADTIWLMDLNLNFLYISPSEKSMRGYSADETIHQSMKDILTPQSYIKATTFFENHLRKFINGENPETTFTIELEQIHKNKSIILTENRVTLLSDEKGKPYNVLGITRDITEKKNIEIENTERSKRAQMQRDSLAELATNQLIRSGNLDDSKSIFTKKTSETLNVSRASIWLIDEQNNFMKCIDLYDSEMQMHTSGDIFNLSEVPIYYAAMIKFLQISISDIDTHPAIVELKENYFKKYNISSTLETLAYSEDGTKCMFCLEHRGHKRIWKQDEEYYAKVISSLVLQTINLAKRRELEERLKRNEEKLAQSQKLESLGILAGGIAHDFNNILAGIYGYIQVLQMSLKDNPQMMHYLNQTLKASERAKELISQILAFARKTDSEKLSVSVTNIAKEVHKLIKASIPSTIEINLEYAKDIPFIYANPTQIHQVLVNLCTNAFHALQNERGYIYINIEKTFISSNEHNYHGIPEGDYVKIMVSDNGVGIPPEIIDKIYDPYFTTKPQGEGTGLGLSTVMGIVKNHQGTIKVYSEVGEGTTFIILLPAISEAADEQDNSSKDNFQTGKESILLVDDEEAILEATQLILENLGYEVKTFNSGFEALAEYRNHPDKYDLLISDMNMPQMNGLELIQAIGRINSDLPIIICTGFSSKLLKLDTKEHNIKKVLMKPLTVKELSETIREIFK